MSTVEKRGTPDYFIFDCETGGLDPKKNALCEIAGVLIDGEDLSVKVDYETIIKPASPELTFESKAMEVNGLDPEFIKQNGEDPEIVVEELKLIFQHANQDKKRSGLLVFVGHNVKFDLGFLHELFKSQGEDLTKYCRTSKNIYGDKEPDSLDTVDLSHGAWAKEKMAYNLGECCRKGGISLIGAHRAMNDVMGTYELFRKHIINLRSSGGGTEQDYKSRKKFSFDI